MKILTLKPELCDGCKTCEKACSKAFFKEENSSKASLKITGEKGNFKITVCSQCGECINVCATKSIYRAKTGTVMVKKDSCVACYSCVGFCPISAMFYHKDILPPFKCTACGICVKKCPKGALSLEEIKTPEESKV